MVLWPVPNECQIVGRSATKTCYEIFVKGVFDAGLLPPWFILDWSCNKPRYQSRTVARLVASST